MRISIRKRKCFFRKGVGVMSRSSELTDAKRARKDEFYTQYSDIAKEVAFHKDRFEDKIVLCNCDEPFKSEFFNYFVKNFTELKLLGLICLGYKGRGDGTVVRYDGNLFSFGKVEGDGRYLAGDFRSRDSVALLDEADIVVTNPPFSLFREYISLLVSHGKDFLVLGNINAVTYKEVFPLIRDGKVWLGASIHSGDRKFHVPDGYPLEASGCGFDGDGRRFIMVKGVRWFTNLDYPERYEGLGLSARYSKKRYRKFDNCDAVNVDRTKDIPKDYGGVMGVPITFLDKYSPRQFEILGLDKDFTADRSRGRVGGKTRYARFFIRNREV